MPEGMPFYLEKAPTLRLMEQHLNMNGLAALAALNQPNPPSLAWMLGEHALWGANARFGLVNAAGLNKPGQIAHDWFGFSNAAGAWAPNKAAATTGYWTNYRGEVDEIVRRTLSWALQIALGVDEKGQGTPRKPKWDIELFWVCSASWFEGWVVSRPVNQPAALTHLPARLLNAIRRARGTLKPDQPKAPAAPLVAKQGDRGVVTVVFMTPPHKGSVVARSPLPVADLATGGKWAHPVPSRQPHYEVRQPPAAHKDAPQPARDRRYAMWVVTHAKHRTFSAPGVMVTDDSTKGLYGDEIKIPLGTVYSGYAPNGQAEPVAIVAPSMPSGGITAHGVV